MRRTVWHTLSVPTSWIWDRQMSSAQKVPATESEQEVLEVRGREEAEKHRMKFFSPLGTLDNTGSELVQQVDLMVSVNHFHFLKR